MLPPEILSVVCGCVPKPALKNLRQVCKAYEQAATPYLFDEIFLSFNATDLRIAKLFVIRFKQYISKLTFSSNYYKDLDESDFIEAYQNYDGMGDDPDAEATLATYAFRLHCETRKMQKETLQSGTCPAYLSFVLANTPNLQKIVLTDKLSSRSMSLSSLEDHLPWPLKTCPEEGCDLFFEHLGCSRDSGFARKGIDNPWRTILLGLIATNSTVKELTMERQECELPTNSAAFNLSPPELRDAKLCFGALTKLHLSLAIENMKYTSNGESYFVHRNVAKLLRAARNLRCLSVLPVVEDSAVEYPSIRAVLGRCEFPSLTSLILVFFNSSEADLRRILKRSRKLEQLTTQGHTLTSGSWALLANWAKTSLPLKSVSFNQLYGGFEEPWEDIEYTDYFGDVESFFNKQGINPFDAQNLRRNEATPTSRQVTGAKDSYLERISMFH